MEAEKNKKVLIIFNPEAGQHAKHKFKRIIEELKKNELQIDIINTQYSGHAKIIAQENVNNKYAMLIAAGGDGTINEVLNGIYPTLVPFAIIPLGTANVLAKEIQITNDTSGIVNYILNGSTKPLWLGKSNNKYFALMMSTGLDAVSVAKVNKKLKKWFGKFAYIVSFAKAVIDSKNITYKVIIENKTYYSSGVIVSNGKFYGGEYICAPDASLQENKLYTILTKNSGRISALKYAFLMLLQRLPYSDSVTILPVTKLKINCEQKNIPTQIDGDDGGYIPVNISISDQYINFQYPP